MVVGAEIEIIVLLLLDFAVCVHPLDLREQVRIDQLDVLLLTWGDSLILRRQVKFDWGRDDHAVDLHPIQRLGIGIDGIGIPLGHRPTAAKNLHSHILVQEQALDLFAVALSAQAISGSVRVLIGVVVNLLLRRLLLGCRRVSLRLGGAVLLGWLLLRCFLRSDRSGQRVLLRLRGCLMDADIVRVQTTHRLHADCRGHQLIPRWEGVCKVCVILLGKFAGKPAAPAPLRTLGQLPFFDFRNGRFRQHQGKTTHHRQNQQRHKNIDKMQRLAFLFLHVAPSLKPKV